MNGAPKRVVIVGGGLAGMAAGVALERTGAVVTILEARRSAGGRAGSYQHPLTGEVLDNCQHVLLGCCTNLIDFFRRIGASDLIRWSDKVWFVDAQAQRHVLRAMDYLPAPLHLALSAAGFAALDISQRLALARAMRAMLRLGRKGYNRLGNVSFGTWLAHQHQPASLIDQFYDLVLVSALNERAARVSAKYAIQVFYDGMLANRRAFMMGVPNVSLERLYAKLPCRDLRLETRVAEVRFAGNRALGVTLADGQSLDADYVILATNHHAALRLIPDELVAGDGRFAKLGRLESVPILGAHLWFDRPVLHLPQVALMSGPLQWLFAKDAAGTAVHGVISTARDWTGETREKTIEQFLEQIRQVLPAARLAVCLRHCIVMEKRATFSPLPGVDECRPQQGPPPGGIQGLILAGDYTQTGWPATMEGAVRSGYLAAEAVTWRRFLVDDLPVEWPAKVLSWF